MLFYLATFERQIQKRDWHENNPIWLSNTWLLSQTELLTLWKNKGLYTYLRARQNRNNYVSLATADGRFVDK